MPKKLYYLTTEITPFANVSGLGEFSAKVPFALQEKGHDIRTIIPKYGYVSERNLPFKSQRSSVFFCMYRKAFCSVYNVLRIVQSFVRIFPVFCNFSRYCLSAILTLFTRSCIAIPMFICAGE